MFRIGWFDNIFLISDHGYCSGFAPFAIIIWASPVCGIVKYSISNVFVAIDKEHRETTLRYTEHSFVVVIYIETSFCDVRTIVSNKIIFLITGKDWESQEKWLGKVCDGENSELR